MILENAGAFSSCGVQSREFIQCPAGSGTGETPQPQTDEEATPRPAESKCTVLKSMGRIFTYNKNKRTFLKDNSLITRF